MFNGSNKKRIYNFVLNSNLGSGTPASGETFYVDWSIMPEGEYKVSFAFTSGSAGADFTATNTAVIYLDLGQSSTSVCQVAPTSTQSPTRGTFLGCLRQSSYVNVATTAGIPFLYADTDTNPPLYIFNRPRNSNCYVEIHTGSATQQTNFTPIGGYILTLSFELQN